MAVSILLATGDEKCGKLISVIFYEPQAERVDLIQLTIAGTGS